MINKIKLILFLAISIATKSIGQTSPFTDSEKIIKTSYNYNNFDKISLLDIDGSTEIEVGDTFKIEIKIREKYLPILLVSEKNNELEIKFNYTKENNKYISDPRIKIKITCPKLETVYKQGNSAVEVILGNQNKFFMYNEGNGSATLKGIVKDLSIKNEGNGKTDAARLLAENVNVASYGNGDVLINGNLNATGKRYGNGKIIQKGNAILLLQ
jgi:hypothetical protein